MISPDDLITSLRNTDIYIEKIYLNGGCYQFYLFLKSIYLDAAPYINAEKNHIATKIGEHLYDITGRVTEEMYPLTARDEEDCKCWSFWKFNWLYKECPHCGEMVG